MMKMRSWTIGLGLGLAAVAAAQPVSYATKSVTINAGVLVTPQDPVGVTITSAPFNTVPFVWQNLDKARGVKPSNWVFANPNGGSSLADRDRLRWLNPDLDWHSGAFPDSSGYAAGNRIDKTFAPYWEVSLGNASETVLGQYDVLLLPVMGIPRLTSSEREKLRRFVDKGGILWVDMVRAVGITDPANSIPGPFLVEADAGTQLVSIFHPLMQTPNRISVRDLQLSGGIGVSARSVVPGDLGVANAFGGLVTESNEWDPVAVTNLTDSLGRPNRTIGVMKIGDGAVVLTTRGLSLALNQSKGGGFNDGFRAGDPDDSERALAAAKIAVNIVSLAANFTSASGGSRSDNSVPVSVEAPAIKRYTAPAPNGFTGATGLTSDLSDTSTPAMFNGRVVTSQGGRVVVYDAKPNNNLDGDIFGNPDDGLPEPFPGAPYDVIWESQSVGTKLSSPVVIENANNTTGIVEQVWVRDESGRVHVFNLSASGAGIAPILTINPPSPAQADLDIVFPVTYHEGLVYVYDFNGTQGRVWVIDAKTGTLRPSGSTDWSVEGFGRPQAAPTVGYIPIDDNSGGSDRVMYLASGNVSGSGTASPPTLTSAWLGAKGESPSGVSLVGSTLRINTRARGSNLPIAGGSPGSPAAPMVRIIDPNGNFATLPQLNNWISGITVNSGANGVVDIALSGGADGFDWTGSTPATNDDYSIRIDYSIDWGGVTAGIAQARNYQRGSLTLVDQNSPSRAVIGSPALSPNGFLGVSVANLGYSSGNTGSGGTVYILKEKGRGSFLVRTRFELYDNISGGINVRGSTTPLPYREAIIDQDNLNTVLPFLDGQIRGLRPVGAPAIRNGLLMVSAAGQKVIGFGPADVTVLLAFKAEPPVPEIVLNSPGNDDQLKLRQPDMAKSQDQTNPAISGTLGAGSFTVEPIPDSNQVRVVLESLASTNRNTITACLANNLPVLAEWGSSAETVIEPEGVNSGVVFGGQSRGTFNPLQYYTVFVGYRGKGNPVITGNTAYIAGTSLLPELIATGSLTSFNGLMYAIDIDVSPNDPFLQANTIRPWQRQLWLINGGTPGNFNNVSTSSNFKWPQFRGIRNLDDFRIRILQARVEGDSVYGMAAGDDGIAVTYAGDSGNDELQVFSRSDFLVVDAGRIARFDPSGNPIWAAERTVYAGAGSPVSAARNIRPLSEPSRAYPDGNSGTILVDPGNNMVARLDAAGREIRTITQFKNHPSFRPDGMTPSETSQLRRPNDVVSWTTYRSAAEVAAQFPGEVLYQGATDERWDHWLIADTGNNRAIEVIDRYRVVSGIIERPVYYADESGDFEDGGTRYAQGQGVLIWHTPSQFTGKSFAYSSLYRQVVADAGQPNGVRTVFALGFNNVEPGRASVGLDSSGVDSRDNAMGFGGVILFDGPDAKVITEFEYPAILAGTFLGRVGTGYGFNLPSADQPASTKKIAGLRSVTAKYVPNPFGVLVPAVMVTTQDGIYELYEELVAGEPVWRVRWMLPREAYVGMRRPQGTGPFPVSQLSGNPADFRPMYARRLDSDDVLIVNGYGGTYIGGTAANPFNGEVALIDGRFLNVAGFTQFNEPGYGLARRNLGFNSLSVTFELPPVQGIRGIVRPVFAERQ